MAKLSRDAFRGIAIYVLFTTATVVTNAEKKNVLTVPFKVDALDYAYAREKDPTNEGDCIYDGPYSVDAVGTYGSACSAACAIGHTQRGEWVEYLFSSPTDDFVDIAIHMASDSENNKVLLKVDGSSVAVLKGPGLGSGQYRMIEAKKVFIEGDGMKHKLLVKFLSKNINLCSVGMIWSNREFDVPFIAEARDFSRARDSDAQNQGDCGPGPVDADYNTRSWYSRSCPSTCVIASTEAGEWVNYKFKSNINRNVDISVRFASENVGKAVMVKLNGKFLKTLDGPGERLNDHRKQTISDVAIEGGVPYNLRVKFLTTGVSLCSVSVVPKRSDDKLTLVAKYKWQDGAKDSSGSLIRHDGVIDTYRGVAAENGVLTLPYSRSGGVNLGFFEELDGADVVKLRFEEVKIVPNNTGYSVLAGGNRDYNWWVGLSEKEFGQSSRLVFNVGGWYSPSYEHWVDADVSISHIESIDYRFNGTKAPGKRLAIRYNDGDWVSGGWTDPKVWRKFFSNSGVKIRFNADWDNYEGTLGPVSIWANI